ncbi:unnamed protein product [Sphagnum jensenii]|uniref:Uncharacterized protein n=1 Tax=Sphagnum jensenii TaxID=128206 RepID=A0ABP1ARD8_9BRYO
MYMESQVAALNSLNHLEDRHWRKHSEGRSHFGAANFLEVSLSDEEATAIVEDKIPEQPVEEFLETTEGINIAAGRKWQDAVAPYEEPRAEINDTKGEQDDVVGDKICVKVVEATKEMDSIPEEATI